MNTIDCLIIGHNEMALNDYENLVLGLGRTSGAYRDLSLSLLHYGNKSYTAMDFANIVKGHEIHDKNTCFYNSEEFSPAIAYLGTYLNKRGYTFDYINLFQKEKEELRKKLTENKILTVAITTTLHIIAFPIIEIIEFIKKYNKHAKIILGGPYIFSQYNALDSMSFDVLMKSLNADYYIVNSQGEKALTQIIDYEKKMLKDINLKNILSKEKTYRMNPVEREENALEDNMVDWRLFKPEDVGDYVSYRTSISCPFSCSFCGFPQRAGAYKYVDETILEKNLDALSDLGHVRVLHFIDDTFNIPLDRFKAILRMMIKKGYGFKWNSMIRCQYLDRETVELMKESGCQGVFLGIESASDTILKNMNKHTTIQKYRDGIRLLHESGILTYASFIIGFPGETTETVQETIDFIEEEKPTFYRTQLWYCDPITPIWKEKDKYEIKGSAFQWSHKTMNSDTACNLIDRIFTNTKNAIWLPQYKFEINGLYHILNKGMDINEIKEFLLLFNKLVGEKIASNSTAILKQRLFDVIKGSRFESDIARFFSNP